MFERNNEKYGKRVRERQKNGKKTKNERKKDN